ncbi:MAG: hypothetical protein DRP78_04545 [Candidatus Omnitrophota bacterium]|nr:MAG: hypothetical protein DRP78_04545 [Candidatus Omnitrophota bacterium]
MVKIKLYMCGGEYPISEFPLGLGYLKTNCKADIEIVKNKKDLKECDFIGLSTNAWGIKEAVDILNATEIPVVIGGQGTLWKGLEDYNFSHIVIGEGENALNRIIDGADEKIIRMSNIKDIDSLKFPDRGRCGEHVPIFTSRGCPFRCSFCSSQNFWKNIRFHSAEYFIEEVEYILKRYPQVKVLRIFDDLFIANRKRFEKIFELWLKKNFQKRLKLKGFVRSNIVDLIAVKMMKKIGFLSIRFGAESGSDRILKLLNKGNTVEDNQRAIDIANHVGLPIQGSFMYDIPGERKEDLELTKDFIKRNQGKMSVSGWYKFRSFPGTLFYAGEDLMKTDMKVR